MKISAIVVTYNRLNLLRECLSKLLNQDYELNNIFIVNNKSTDGTKKYLNNLNNDKIIPINSNKNLGGAGGFNLGLKMAYEKSESDLFWLMDDDTMPTHKSLNALVKASNKLNNNFGFLCSNVRWWKDNSPVNLPEVSKESWSKLLPDNLIKVKCATFVSILIRRNVIRKLGLPISDMFILGDDYEYSTRISKHFESYFVSDSIVIHKCNKINESIYNTKRIRRYNYKYRNNLFIARKYYGFKNVSKEILNDLYICIGALFISNNNKIKRSFCILNSIFKGLFFNPKICYPNTKSNNKIFHS